MGVVCCIGLDIAKNTFQVHGVDKRGKELFNKRLKRAAVLPFFANLPACLIGLEACGGSHHWAREIAKLDAGHRVRLISPRHIKPFVLNNKTDAADARAICEVVRRPSTRFVNVKTIDQQDMSAWHRLRERKVKERTALVNQARALLMEQGVIIPKGITHVRKQLPGIIEELENGLSLQARDYLSELYAELVDVDAVIAKYEGRIMSFAKTNEACKRLQKIPGVGPLTATAIVAHVGNAMQFKNGRAFAASLGLTPKEHSSGGKQKLLGISKRGNNGIRWLLIQGARIVTRYTLLRQDSQLCSQLWLQGLSARRGRQIAAVALANKTARTIWALLARGEEYRPSPA
ncbi:MAG: IS110 family transposase [Clostridium sp.]|nr:IS110 family transposase [Clostridium sp.]